LETMQAAKASPPRPLVRPRGKSVVTHAKLDVLLLLALIRPAAKVLGRVTTVGGKAAGRGPDMGPGTVSPLNR
jgi:hypothetical protein